MHPDPAYRSDDRVLSETLIDGACFGMVFAPTPRGPRVAHTPLLRAGEGAVRFHLARSNDLSDHLEGARALIVVNGPDAYVSPRWYDNRDTVPTWDYVALEIEGTVRRMTDGELEAFLHAAIEKHEARLGGETWQAQESSERTWSGLFRGIVGFELAIEASRPTAKLSQRKRPAERARIAAGLEDAGAAELARLVREGTV
ncbi:transcriptional regulator [Erythrobacter litoralis]|uniref:Negative transcriptional regulator n=1 Tax=Erythrobacter litoralis TaxID=39960 RepID=A0A074MKK9_9SPHN|nr:FMN-binding negative transcriptional regulator [Erythrobacter litoralis]AOL24425.1 transcriptional regulator [Erythrobacter litoralis]KEO93335.1 negative transcriptional regulator [Erythrobacter litoralis]